MLYVDDFPIVRKKKNRIKEAIKMLQSKFEVKKLRRYQISSMTQYSKGKKASILKFKLKKIRAVF